MLSLPEALSSVYRIPRLQSRLLFHSSVVTLQRLSFFHHIPLQFLLALNQASFIAWREKHKTLNWFDQNANSISISFYIKCIFSLFLCVVTVHHAFMSTLICTTNIHTHTKHMLNSRVYKKIYCQKKPERESEETEPNESTETMSEK